MWSAQCLEVMWILASLYQISSTFWTYDFWNSIVMFNNQPTQVLKINIIPLPPPSQSTDYVVYTRKTRYGQSNQIGTYWGKGKHWRWKGKMIILHILCYRRKKHVWTIWPQQFGFVLFDLITLICKKRTQHGSQCHRNPFTAFSKTN